MEISDVTQGSRRVRVLMDAADLQGMLVGHAAAAAGVVIGSPGVRVESFGISTGVPGRPTAEVVLVVTP